MSSVWNLFLLSLLFAFAIDLPAAKAPTGLVLTPVSPSESPPAGGGQTPSADANKTASLILADLDGDGDLDIVTEDVKGQFFLDVNLLGSFSSRIPLYPSPVVGVATDGTPGTAVGSLLPFDPDDANGSGQYAFALVAGEGDSHNSNFAVDANGTLRLSSAPPAGELSVRVRVSDATGLSFERVFVLNSVAPVVEEQVILPIAGTGSPMLEANGSVVLQGELLSNGGGENIEVGFLLGPNSRLDVDDSTTLRIEAVLVGTSFSVRLTNLTEGRHYLRAYAKNPQGETQGSARRVVVSSAEKQTADVIDPDEVGKPTWTFGTGGFVRSSPAIAADGTVYVGSGDKKVYALDPKNGEKIWEFETGDAVYSSPAIGADGTVYVGSQDRKVYALDPQNGEKIWEFETGGFVESSPAIAADGTVYVGSGDKKVYALDPQNGQVIWAFQTGSPVYSSPAIGADGTVYVGSNDKKLYALDPQNGVKVWEFETGDHVESSPAVGTDGTVYVGSNDKKVYALDPQNGLKVWEFETGDHVESSPAVGTDGTVYVGSNDKNVYALDPKNGEKIWEFKTRFFVQSSSPAVGADGTVYIGSGDKRIYGIDGTSGKRIWAFRISGFVYSSPTIGANGIVYVGSHDKKVYAMQGSSGPADSPWSMFGRNAQRTGSMEGANYIYTLVDGNGSTSNNLFTLNSNGILRTATSLDYEDKSSHSIGVRATDENNASLEKVLAISVTNAFTPIVYTLPVEVNDDGGITFRGKILPDDGSVVTAMGVKVSTGPHFVNPIVIPGNFEDSTEEFSVAGTGLASGKKYYYRAYATNAEGTTDGAHKRFMTPETIAPVQSWWADAEEAAAGWRSSTWFGAFRPYANGWLYHVDLGWLYARPDGADGFWLWMEAKGWLWSTPRTYPYLYCHEDSVWLYFLKRKDGRARFYNYATGGVEYLQIFTNP